MPSDFTFLLADAAADDKPGAAVFFAYQHWLIRDRDPGACLRAFLNNHFAGMAIFIGILLDYIYR
jgi:4-hydroxybenzoate polyprenyltransferase